MAITLAGPTNSPTTASGNPATLDAAPPMPRDQRRSPSVLFTPPASEGAGANGMGADPQVQTMESSAIIDQQFQKLATLYPGAVDPLSQLQNAFRQLIMALATAPTSPAAIAGAPGIVPPLPQQGGPAMGTQAAPGL